MTFEFEFESGPATLNDVRKFFNIESVAKFSAMWKNLTDKDKAELKEGIGNGSLTY